MTRWLLRSTLLLSLGIPTVARASDAQLWITTAATVRLSDKWRLSEEAVARISDDSRGFYEIENSTLLGYKVAKGVVVWAGYTHNPSYIAGRPTAMEHRAREQVTMDHLVKLGPGMLSGRFRIEQRWREGANGTGWRLRPSLRYTLPLGDKQAPSLNIGHESFVDLNTTSFQHVRGLERMRNLVALDVPLGKHVTAELGYLNQHGFVSGARDTNDHVASASISLSL